MSFPPVYTPTVANTQDGENITLCKILDTLAAGGGTGGGDVNITKVGGNAVTTTLPVSASSLPLPTGASTSALQPALNGDGGALAHVTNFPATQPISGTVTLGSGTNNIGNVNPDSALASGSASTGSPLVVTTTGFGTLAFKTNGGGVGTCTIEASVDGTTWDATTYVAFSSGGISTNFNAAVATAGQINTSGIAAIRFRSATFTGTLGVSYILSKTVSNIMLDNPLPAGSNVIGGVTSNITQVNGSTLSLGGANVASALPVTVARKLAVTGFASVATTTTYNNLLDPVAGSTSTDVRDYNSCLLTIVSTATTGSYTVQGSFDSAGTIGLVTLQVQEITVITATSVINGAITPTNATRVFRVNTTDVNYLQVNLTSGISAGTIQAYATLSQATCAPTEQVVVQNTGTNLSTNVAQIASSSINNSSPNGIAGKSMTVGLAGPIQNIDYSAKALVAGASGTLGAPSSFTGSGASVAYDINLTAFSASSSGGIIFALVESLDGAFSRTRTIWMSEPLTATGTVSIPATRVDGRREIVWWTVNNSTITSGTVTITAQDCGGVAPRQVNFFDRGTNTISGTGYTGSAASTLALATATTTSSPFIIEGMTKITFGLYVTGGVPTTAPVIALQVSNDGSNWFTTSTTLTPSAAGYIQTSVNNIYARYARAIVTTGQATGSLYTLGYVSIYGVS